MTTVVQRESVEKIQCTIGATADPTSSAVEWGFTTDPTRPSTYFAGTWGTPVLLNGEWIVTTISPLIGTGSLDLAPGVYLVWARFTVGSEVIVKYVGPLSVA